MNAEQKIMANNDNFQAYYNYTSQIFLDKKPGQSKRSQKLELKTSQKRSSRSFCEIF